MLLRDEIGEVEVKIGDLFEAKGCTFSVICPEFRQSPSNPPVWVRLKSGVLVLEDGRRFEIRADGIEELREPVFLFTSAVIARCIRESRLKTPAPDIQAARTRAESRSAPTKKRAEQNHPTSENLF